MEGKLLSYTPGSLTAQYAYIYYDGRTSYYTVRLSKRYKLYHFNFYSPFAGVAHYKPLPLVESYDVNLTATVNYSLLVLGHNKYTEYPEFLVNILFTINEKNEITQK